MRSAPGDPSREETRIPREESGGVGDRGLDVSTQVTEHERVALEDADGLGSHAGTCSGTPPSVLSSGPGKSRWNSMPRPTSPSQSRSPRMPAVKAFFSPARKAATIDSSHTS